MNNEEKIKAIQEKIDNLSMHIHSSQQQLRSLQAELNGLKSALGIQVSSKQPGEVRQSASLENFIGLKLIHLVGIVVLVTGIAIGVKYAIDKQLISEVMRIVFAYIAAAVLFVLSIRLRKKYNLFSAILFSGAMASVYFTTYAATVYYSLIPAFLAFVIMLLLTVYTSVMAITYDKKEIAIVGMTGAYAIPFLISANADRVDIFFSYILLINLGIVFLSFKKRWKLMGYLSMIITWLIFIGWAAFKAIPGQLLTGVLFSIIYFVLFFINALAFRIRSGASLSSGEIQQAAINNAAFFIATFALYDSTLNVPFASVTGCLSVVMLSVTAAVFYFLPTEKIMQRVFALQSLLLLTGFIGLQWDGLLVSLLWLALAILLFAGGVVKRKAWIRMAAMLLVAVTLGKLVLLDAIRMSTGQRIICYIIIGKLLLVFSFLYQKYKSVLFTDKAA